MSEGLDAHSAIETTIPRDIVLEIATPPDSVAPLLLAYLTAHLADVERVIGVAISPEATLRDDLAHLDQFLPPGGILLVARRAREQLGCVGLRTIEVDGAPVAEIKRLYVDRKARGLGLGRRLVEAVLAKARDIGLKRVCLDTFAPMTEARALYEKLGFAPIAPYSPNPAPPEFQSLWIYLGRDL